MFSPYAMSVVDRIIDGIVSREKLSYFWGIISWL